MCLRRHHTACSSETTATMPFVIALLLLRLFPGVARTLVRLVGLLVLIGIAAALMH
jgi:hypothetical protein